MSKAYFKVKSKLEFCFKQILNNAEYKFKGYINSTDFLFRKVKYLRFTLKTRKFEQKSDI